MSTLGGCLVESTSEFLVLSPVLSHLRYSNDHMGYFATSREYEVGGYESLLTLWGEGTASKVRQSMNMVASKVKP
jgi:hypothetical protein